VIRRQIVTAVIVLIGLTLLTGVLYPLVVTGVAQTAFPGRADGSLIERDGQVVGSRLVGQAATGPEWFHPRPSAAGDGYDGAASAASNLGPTSPDLAAAVAERAAAYRKENGLAPGTPVPADAATASASGLDPDISPANARLQAPRVARARSLDPQVVRDLVEDQVQGRELGILGEPRVNVLELNLALEDRAGG
jgi:K+-transporting ATPase ATPase C chain